MQNTIKQVLFLALISSTLVGCTCLKKISLKPELTALDVKAAAAGTASFGFDFEFNECCPTKEQKALALSVQKNVHDLYQRLLKDEVTIESYNAKVKAARDAVENVILVCKATNGGQDLLSTPGDNSLTKAWNRLKEVNAQLD